MASPAIVGFAPPVRFVGVVSANCGIATLVAAPPDKRAETDIVSLPTPRNVWVKVIEAEVDPAAIVVAVAEIVNVSCIVVAVEGATERRPKPIAATVTSAMRLKVVFVDICFLSISQVQEFPELGFELIS